MSLKMTVDLHGTSELDRRFDALAHKTDDFTPLMRRIGSYFETRTARRFETATDPEGRPWKKSVRALMGGTPTLTESGRMRDSIVSRATARSVEVGTNVIYAGVHQFGATIVPKNAKALRFRVGGHFVTVKKAVIPARPFLGIVAGDEQPVGRIVDEFLRGGSLS